MKIMYKKSILINLLIGSILFLITLPFALTTNAATTSTSIFITEAHNNNIDNAFDHGIEISGPKLNIKRLFTNTITPTILINEVDSHTTNPENEEFIELYDGGYGNVSLDGLVLVTYNGNTDQSYNLGGHNEAIDLDGYTTDNNGYFVIGNSAIASATIIFEGGTLKGGADAVALYNSNGSDFPAGTPVTSTNLVDAIVYDTNDQDDDELLAVLLNPAQPQVNEAGNGNATLNSNQRCPDGFGGPRNTNTYTQEPPTPGLNNICLPQVLVSKTVNPNTNISPNSSVTYTITLANVGFDDDPNVDLIDYLPNLVSLNSWLIQPNGATITNNILTWSGPLSMGQVITFSFIVDHSGDYGDIITNTVYATGTLNADNDTVVFVVLSANPELSIIKTGPEYAIAGASIVYTLTLNNYSDATASDVVLTDTLPANITYNSDNSGYTCLACISGNTGVITWSVGNLNSLANHTFNLTVNTTINIPSGEDLINNIEISLDSPDDDPGNNTDQHRTTFYPLVSTYDIQTVSDPANDDTSPLNGEIVWVQGIVTAKAGELDSQGKLLVIQDQQGGPWSGLAVILPNRIDLSVPEGTLMQFLGTVAEFQGLTQLELGNQLGLAEVIGTAPLPIPNVLATNNFNDSNKNTSEQWESVLLEFQNAQVTNQDLGLGEWYFDDGSGNARADDMGSSDGNLTYIPALNDYYSYIRGIGWESGNTYKLEPRYDDDIFISPNTPFLNLSKAATPNTNIAYHGEVTYTVTLANLGAVDEANATLTDLLPTGTSFARWVNQPSGASVNGNTLSWMGTVNSGQAIDFIFVVTHIGNYNDIITNTAIASGTTNTTTATTTFTVMPENAELSLSKIGPNYSFGPSIVYTLTLQNNGATPASNVILTDTLPLSTTYLADNSGFSCSACIIGNSGAITWQVGTLLPNSSTQFNLTVTTHISLVNNTTLTNQANTSTDSEGDNPTNNNDQWQTTYFTTQPVYSITFIYHDLENVVQNGETVYLVGEFNNWDPTTLPLASNITQNVFSTTVTNLALGNAYQYKYIVDDGNKNWDWLNTNNRLYTVNAINDIDVNDYRYVLVEWANLESPPTLTTTVGVPTPLISGQVFITNVTSLTGQGRQIVAQVGYGNNNNPANWSWFSMTYSNDNNNNDLFAGVVTPTNSGVYSYATRFNGNWGNSNPHSTWVYGDLNGSSAGGFSLNQTGVLTVSNPSSTHSYSLTITAPVDAMTGNPGNTLNYSIVLTNTGTTTDTFNITLSGNVWTTTTDSQVGPLATGASTSLNVAVTIDANAFDNDSDTVMVMVTSQGDSSVSESVSLTTTATTTPITRAIQLTAALTNTVGNPGQAVNYTLTLTNTGSSTDTFSIILSNNAWPTTAPTVIGPLPAGTSNNFNVTVTIPSNATLNSNDTVTITAISQGDSTKTAMVNLTTWATFTQSNGSLVYLPFIIK